MENKPAFTRRFHQPRHFLMLLIVLLLLLLPGCKRGTPEAEPTAAQGLPAATLPAGETAAPVVFTATAPAGGAQPGEGGTPAAPPAPSPTGGAGAPAACAYPPGWVVYTILPGDTLFRLAISTGSSVDEIQRGNCKEDDRLVAYETLHLPRHPPAHASGSGAIKAPVVIAATGDPCASIFSCTNPGLPSLTLPLAGAGGSGGPCDDGETGPRIISVVIEELLGFLSEGMKEIMIGQATFFFACGFDHPENLRAWVTGPAGTEELAVQGIESLPPDMYPEYVHLPASQKVVIWYPACNLLEGAYTLYVTDNHQTGSLTLDLQKYSGATIMVKPVRVEAGGKIEIFYCGFSDFAHSTVNISLYKFSKTIEGGDYLYDQLKTFDVPINNAGWYQQKQTVPSGTPANRYLLIVNNNDDMTSDTLNFSGVRKIFYFWVTQ